jgi:hypothetical protein
VVFSLMVDCSRTSAWIRNEQDGEVCFERGFATSELAFYPASRRDGVGDMYVPD